MVSIQTSSLGDVRGGASHCLTLVQLVGWAKGPSVKHCLYVHLLSPFAFSFKMSLKCVQSLRRGIYLNLLIELRKAEAAAKLKIWKGEEMSVWV